MLFTSLCKLHKTHLFCLTGHNVSTVPVKRDDHHRQPHVRLLRASEFYLPESFLQCSRQLQSNEKAHELKPEIPALLWEDPSSFFSGYK